MKNRKHLYLLAVLCLAAICILLLVSCEGTGQPVDTTPDTPPTDAPTGVPTDPATEPPTEAPTEEPTAAPTETPTEAPTEPATEAETLWAPGTGIFNEGIVTYEKIVDQTVVDAYPDTKVGEPMKAGESGVIDIFSTGFDTDDVTVGGKMAVRAGGTAKVIDGVCYFPYNAESPDKIIPDGWSTYSVVPGASVSTYKQVELSLDWEIVSRGSGAWMTAIWGCYVSNYAGKIPDGPGDGLWISFNKAAGKLSVYHPDTASWPAGCVDIPVGSVLNGEIHTDIVCTADHSTYVYITPAGGDPVLAASILFSNGKMLVIKEQTGETAEFACSTDSLKGENFVLFTHAGGGVYLDALSVLAASKGEIMENVTVKATPAEGQKLGLDITDKTDLVSICYSCWFDAILGGGSEKVTDFNNITEVLEGKRDWGGVPSFHYWAKPAQGYYRSSDKDAIRNNMTLLYEAGVDFVIIDLTNAGDGYIGNAAWTSYIQTPMDAMLDTIMEMRAEGKGTPYVVFWSGTSEGPLYRALLEHYHNEEKWKDCFVYWDGKPLLITTHTDPADFPMKDDFTTRMMWGLSGDHTTYHWNFLNITNFGTVSPDENGNPEQISVATASQETYMSRPTAHGRQGGMMFYSQWLYAFEVHPKIVTLTWWNEWCAQRLDVGGGEYAFTDNYNQEYSRDIEPMEGGHGDQYYQWMKQYISAYKSHADCPLLVEEGYEEKAHSFVLKQQRRAADNG